MSSYWELMNLSVYLMFELINFFLKKAHLYTVSTTKQITCALPMPRFSGDSIRLVMQMVFKCSGVINRKKAARVTL